MTLGVVLKASDRILSATVALIGLALWSVYPAAAADHAITCPRAVADQYATMAFDLQQLDIASGQGEIDHELELRFSMHATIRQLDPARPGWVGPILCEGRTNWNQDVPELDILNEGYMRYYLQHRVSLYNVPRFSIVTLSFRVTEDDDLGLDFADLNPKQGEGSLDLTLWPNDRNGRTPQATGSTRDLTFERRKRIVGNGSGALEDFRAAVEFTVSMMPIPEVGGAVGGTPAPKVGAAIPTPGSRDPGLTDPGQALASREDRCRAYAQTAILQNQMQQQQQCGFAPPVWNSDPNAHYVWCMAGNNITQTESGTLMREAGLASCRQGKP